MPADFSRPPDAQCYSCSPAFCTLLSPICHGLRMMLNTFMAHETRTHHTSVESHILRRFHHPHSNVGARGCILLSLRLVLKPVAYATFEIALCSCHSNLNLKLLYLVCIQYRCRYCDEIVTALC